MNITDMLSKTSEKLERAVSGNEHGTDVLDTLKHEHDAVQEMLKNLVDSDNASERNRLVKEIKAALVPHARAEEKVVYDAIKAVADMEAKTDAAEGYLEHALADKTLEKLASIGDALSPEFSATAKVLKELVNHHIKEEESAVWSDVRKHFSSEERMDMNRRFLAAKQTAPMN